MEGGNVPELEKLISLLGQYEATGRDPTADGIPPDLQDLMKGLQAAGKAGAGAESDEITPHPGWLVKTVDAEGRKVFINVCGTSKIDAPGNWSGNQMPAETASALQRLGALSPQASEALAFPLSAGPLREEADRSGEPCCTLDCILNAEVVRHAGSFKPLKLFINDMVIGFVSDRHNLKLDPKYKLPKTRYFGGQPQPQRIRREPSTTPKVSELPSVALPDPEPTFALRTSKAAARLPAKSSAAVSPPAQSSGSKGRAADRKKEVSPALSVSQTAAQASAARNAQQIRHSVVFEGQPVRVVIEVKFGSVACLKLEDAFIEVCGERVFITVSSGVPYEIELPFAVTSEGARATLDIKHQTLHLELPFRPFKDVLAEIRRGS